MEEAHFNERNPKGNPGRDGNPSLSKVPPPVSNHDNPAMKRSSNPTGIRNADYFSSSAGILASLTFTSGLAPASIHHLIKFSSFSVN